MRRIHSIVEIAANDMFEAALVPDIRGFSIRVAAKRSSARRRASIAHEIAHTFFFDVSSSPPVRALARTTSGVTARKEEEVCWAFARELLLPAELMPAVQRTDQFRLEHVLMVASQFAVSDELVLHRYLWDLPGMEDVCAIVVDEEHRYGDGWIVRKFKRLFGPVAKTRAKRKRGAKALALVTEAVRKGWPGDAVVEQLCGTLAPTATLEFRSTTESWGRRARILVRFN
jgi:hypothetical protein